MYSARKKYAKLQRTYTSNNIWCRGVGLALSTARMMPSHNNSSLRFFLKQSNPAKNKIEENKPLEIPQQLSLFANLNS